MNGQSIAIASLMITVLLALLGGIWKLSTLAARIEVTVENLKEELAALKKDREALSSIPDHDRRIALLESLYRDLSHKVSWSRGRLSSSPEEA